MRNSISNNKIIRTFDNPSGIMEFMTDTERGESVECVSCDWSYPGRFRIEQSDAMYQHIIVDHCTDVYVLVDGRMSRFDHLIHNAARG